MLARDRVTSTAVRPQPRFLLGPGAFRALVHRGRDHTCFGRLVNIDASDTVMAHHRRHNFDTQSRLLGIRIHRVDDLILRRASP